MTNFSELSKLASETIRKGKLEEVYKLAAKAKENGHFEVAYYLEGTIEAKRKNFDNAINLFNKALEINPSFIGPLNAIGICYLKLGKYEKAIDTFLDCIKRYDERPAPRYNLGKAFLAMGRNEDALTAFLTSIEKGDKNIRVYRGTCEAAYRIDDMKTCRRIADVAYSKFKDKETERKKLLSVFMNEVGGYFFNKGENETAKDFAEKSFSLDKNPIFLVNKGICLHNSKDYDGAISNYEKALELDPNLAFAYFNLARAYALKKEYKKSIDNIKKTVDIKDEYLDAVKTESDLKIFKLEKVKNKTDLKRRLEALKINTENKNSQK